MSDDWNWSGTYRFGAQEVVSPTSIDELCDLVARTPAIRALGTRHSFNPLADTPGTLVSTTGLPADINIREADRTVEVGGGTRYAVLARWLQDHGWALHNMGSLPHISVAGAVSTGTHGSGDGNGSLSTAVRGLSLVGPDGSLRSVSQNDSDLAGMVVSLGQLGVVARVRLAIEPSYLVRQDVYRGLQWNDLLHDPLAVTGAGYSVSVFTDWSSDAAGAVWVKRRVADADEPIPDRLLSARRDPRASQQIVEAAEDNTTQHGVAGAWSEHLPHFRIDSTPSSGAEIQTEYFIARTDAAPALRAVRALREQLAPHLIISELRTIAADDLWLSPAYRRDSLAIHFTWHKHPRQVPGLTSQVEAALAPFSPRPHWGKVHTMTAEHVAAQYPRMGVFRDLVLREDPGRKFAGPYADQLLGLSSPSGPRT